MLYETDSKRWTEIEEKKYTRATRLTALGRLLEGDGLLLAHSADNGNKKVFAFLETGVDTLANFAFRNTNVVLGVAVLVHQVQEAIVDIDLWEGKSESAIKNAVKLDDTHQLVFSTTDVGDIHVVGGRANIFL